MANIAEPRAAALAGPDFLEAEAAPAKRLSGVHIGALDGIRGVAILLVLVHHYGASARGFGFYYSFLKATDLGWCGVDLFFVLSGFLITGILYDSRNDESYFRNFYARRVLRIMPLYYTALLFVVLLSTAWPDAGVWGTTSPLWVVFYLTNFVMAFEGPHSVGLMGHYWSLAIEEHFYLIWPVLVLWGTRRHLMGAAAALVVLALVLRTGLVLSGAEPIIVSLQTPLRIDALAAGAFVALAIRGPNGIASLMRPAWIVMMVCGATVLLLIAGPSNVHGVDPIMLSVGFTLIALAFAGSLVVGIGWRPANAIFNLGILRWFGRYSYGMYVWHPIINMLMFYTSIKTALDIEGPTAGALYMAFVFGIVLLVSLASYHFLEKPFLRLKKYFH